MKNPVHPESSGRAKQRVKNSFFMPEKENIKEQDLQSPPAPAGWKRWLNYQSIVKQVPFFLFLATLAVMYIYNGHYADNAIRNINRTEKEVKELKYEYISVKSKIMYLSKQSELIKTVEPLGLKELVQSPVVLIDSAGAN